jgi:hypothetical protein
LKNFILTGSYDLNSIKCVPSADNTRNFFSIESSLVIYRSSGTCKQSPCDANNAYMRENGLDDEYCDSVSEHPIEIDEYLCFYLKDNINLRFKSILALLEYYLTHDRYVFFLFLALYCGVKLAFWRQFISNGSNWQNKKCDANLFRIDRKKK